ncbi:exonuclease domain-containing protein [Candidatus Clostridium stratigraminis]|uniref:Exonuclease domain-containing protein n=1 Tax=Candidatus Clostridium stratigraminis TaxID=3381661 RepID=A0ABW8T0Y6_9CLOT
MNYIVFDLEFNQHYNSAKDPKGSNNPFCPFEIIQIGAVKLDENLKKISTYNSFIKPEIYSCLSPFISEITGITEETLRRAPSHSIVYKDFVQFIGKGSCILCVWGKADIKELYRNYAYHNFDISILPKEYIDLQKYASKYFNCPKGVLMGLKNAVELLHIPINNNFHDALSDAKYTSKVFRKINDEAIIPKFYDLNKPTIKLKKANSKIDFIKLYMQFEKMYNREMSKEEKSIIKLAYMMGKTNQFQK